VAILCHVIDGVLLTEHQVVLHLTKFSSFILTLAFSNHTLTFWSQNVILSELHWLVRWISQNTELSGAQYGTLLVKITFAQFLNVEVHRNWPASFFLFTTFSWTIIHLYLLLCLFTLGGVSGLNSWFPECSVLGILQGDPQFLHVPSDAIHPSPSWFFPWHHHINNCSHFVVFFHSLHVSIPA